MSLRVYIGSPGNQLQADAASGMPVLVSFGSWKKFKPLTAWLPSFDRILIDSGAYSELNSGVAIDVQEYVEWAEKHHWADAYAGLDDISGDWKRSLRNYQAGGFPTYHDSDPYELLDDLIPMARERGGWIGIGLKPPRQGKERFLRDTLLRLPPDLNVHGWALGAYTHLERLDSIDSTHWWREAMKYRKWFPWLTYGETLRIAVKKIQREPRMIVDDEQLPLLARRGRG